MPDTVFPPGSPTPPTPKRPRSRIAPILGFLLLALLGALVLRTLVKGGDRLSGRISLLEYSSQMAEGSEHADSFETRGDGPAWVEISVTTGETGPLDLRVVSEEEYRKGRAMPDPFAARGVTGIAADPVLGDRVLGARLPRGKYFILMRNTSGGNPQPVHISVVQDGAR